MAYDELVQEYVGYALFARPEFQYDKRAQDDRIAYGRTHHAGKVMGLPAFDHHAVAFAHFLFDKQARGAFRGPCRFRGHGFQLGAGSARGQA